MKFNLATIVNKRTEVLHALGLLPLLIAILKRLIWAPLAIREELQKDGVNVVPANFYSNTPSIEEIHNSFEYATQEPPYLNNGLFNAAFMERVLTILMPYAAEFEPPQNGNEELPVGYFWNNSQFSYSDAMSCYAMVRYIKPHRIIEVGSGFSSLICSSALIENGVGEMYCIEPYPRPFLHNVPCVKQLIQKSVQQVSIDFFNDLLRDGDILFIDSTHTVKIGSDCLHIYLKILPALRHRIMVHVHDIFLPDALPQDWALSKHIYWTEQYLLLAYLLDNPRVTVWFGSNYHLRQNRKALNDFMHGRFQSGGGSFWFEIKPAIMAD